MPYIRTGNQPKENRWLEFAAAIMGVLATLACIMALAIWAVKKTDNMKANNYQDRAMTTRMDTCNNIIYMLGLLHEEASELQGKFNKAQRKGLIRYEDNNVVWQGTLEEYKEFQMECHKELGDVCWAVAGIAEMFGWELGEVMQTNLDKLADRRRRGVIDGKGDNR